MPTLDRAQNHKKRHLMILPCEYSHAYICIQTYICLFSHEYGTSLQLLLPDPDARLPDKTTYCRRLGD